MSDTTVDLAGKFGETAFSNFEVLSIGEAVLSWIEAVRALGHASPASTLDYTKATHTLDPWTLIVRDFVAWTSGRLDTVEDGCRDRLADLMENGEWGNHNAQKMRGLFQTPTDEGNPRPLSVA